MHDLKTTLSTPFSSSYCWPVKYFKETDFLEEKKKMHKKIDV